MRRPTLVLTFALLVLGPTGLAAVGPSEEDRATESFLRTAEVTKVEDIGEGITRPQRITLHDGEREGRAIFKTVDVEIPGLTRTNSVVAPVERDFTDRWTYEVAAYRLDRLLGLGLVPPTVERTIGEVPGSAQVWLEGVEKMSSALENHRQVGDPELLRQRLMQTWVFDALIYNVDRNNENIMVEASADRFYLIDHSRSFRLTRRLPPLNEEAAIPLSPEFADRLRGLEREALEPLLEGLLTPAQIKSIIKRRELVLAELSDHGLLPASGS